MHTALTMGACSLLLGLALGMVQPMVMSMLHQITPEHRHGEAVGLRMMAINASSVAMPMLFGAPAPRSASARCSGRWPPPSAAERGWRFRPQRR